jgi:NitT/TauT family transport system substrate-binding protein
VAAPASQSGTPAAGGAQPGSQPTAPPAPEAIKVGLPGRSFGFLPFSVALRKGFFKEEGLDPIEVLLMGGDLQPVGLQSGELDYGGAGGTIGRAAAQGLPVKIILFLYERPTWSLVSRPDITSGAQLRGKSIGVTRVGTSGDVGARLATAHLGLADADVTLVTVGIEVYQALAAGAVEAGLLNADATALARTQGYHELVALPDIAVWPFSGFGVSDAKLDRQRAQVKRYVRAQVRGLQFMLDHEAEVAQIATEEFGLEPNVARTAVASALRAVSRANPGGADAEGVARFIDTELNTDVQPAQVFNFTVLEEVQRELGIRR